MSWTGEQASGLACDNAANFLQHLTSFSAQFASHRNAQHLRVLYRGLGDATHRLIPTAFRTRDEHPAMYEMLWEISDSRGRPIAEDARELEVSQRSAELHVAQHFYQFAERAGLSLPPIANESIRQELITGRGTILQMATFGTRIAPGGTNGAMWPPVELLPILGLAQHYGLPTRLLDWSYSPLVSAYFAASGGLRRLSNGDDPESLLCVWATFANTFESYGEFDSMASSGGRLTMDVFPARLVQPATADNPNLALQQGVFTVVTNNQQIENTVATDRRDLPTALSDFSQNSENLMPNLQLPPFLKLQLPIRESPQLMYCLKNLGYSANRIYDGFSGAADAVKEHATLCRMMPRDEPAVPAPATETTTDSPEAT